MLAHRLGAAGDLVGRLALEPQRHEEAADLRRRRLAVHDRVHDRARLVAVEVVPVEQPRERRLDHACLQEVPRELRAERRQHRLGVELDAVDRELAVAHGHDLAVRAGRADLEHVRDAGRGERVVAAGLERGGEAGEEPAAVVLRPALALPWTSSRAGRPRRRRPRRSPGGRGRRRASASSREAARGSPRRARSPPGRPGPGEMTRCDGASRSASSASIASFRRTTTSAPSSPNRCARL